jgi:hypothetical protein
MKSQNFNYNDSFMKYRFRDKLICPYCDELISNYDLETDVFTHRDCEDRIDYRCPSCKKSFRYYCEMRYVIEK